MGREIEKFYYLWCFMLSSWYTQNYNVMKEGELQPHHCLRPGHLFDMTVKWPVTTGERSIVVFILTTTFPFSFDIITIKSFV